MLAVIEHPGEGQLRRRAAGILRYSPILRDPALVRREVRLLEPRHAAADVLFGKFSGYEVG